MLDANMELTERNDMLVYASDGNVTFTLSVSLSYMLHRDDTIPSLHWLLGLDALFHDILKTC